LKHKIEENNYDVIGIVESWANETINDAELTLKGYTMFRLDKKESKGVGGGLLIYVNEKWQSTDCMELTELQFVQSLWCTVGVATGKLLIGLCYRSPLSNGENNENLLKLFEAAINRGGYCNILIMGDFNYPSIDCQQDLVMAGPESAPAKFLEATQDLLLFQHVKKATRIRQGNQPSTLDYVFTDDDNLIDDIVYNEPLGKSDHVILEWELITETTETTSSQPKFNYIKGDYEKITDELMRVDWNVFFKNKSVNQMWTSFKNIMDDLMSQHIPLKKEFKRKKGHWISKATIKLMKQRSKAWRKYRQFQSTANYDEYRKIRNTVTEMVRADGDEHRKRLLRGFKGNPKRFYGYMRGVQSVKDAVTGLKKSDGSITSTDKESADELANCFQQMFTKDESSEQLSQGEGVLESPEVWLDSVISLDPEAVLKKLEKLNIDKSAGPDGMHPMLLKSCARAVAEPLSLIFQCSFDSGVVPDDWKTANIAPIYKRKGSRADPNNYRPVSLTSVPCKIMESLIKDKLSEFINVKKILTRHQHGFMQQRSCLTNLLEAMEKWTEAVDNGYGIDVLFLDYRKAFDSVSHRKLIEKLRNLGIQDKLLRWIEQFLTARTLKVGVRGSFSELIKVLSGVPQGSVLGPLLFLLFVNDLPDWIVSSLKMFADDTKLWREMSSESESSILQKDLDSLTDWSKRWLLKFNPSKCKLMHIGHKLDTEYYMEDDNGSKTKIEEVELEKDLGIYIRNDLKVSTQCVNAAGKARSVIAMIKRNFRRLDNEDFLMIYKTYIRPHVEYCIQVWSPHLKKDIQCLEKVQRSATRLVPSLRKLTYEERLRRLGLTTLEKRRQRGDLIEAFKIMTGKEQVDSEQFFQKSNTGHNLRGHSMKIVMKRCRTDTRKFFFSQRVVQHWNGLPQQVVDATSVNSFKNRLDKHDQDMGI
jgi:hypothetical protein